MSTFTSKFIGNNSRCSRALRVSFLALFATSLMIPLTAQALVCNSDMIISYVSGPNYALVGDTYRVKASLGTGVIDGPAPNALTLDLFRFQLDCDSDSGLNIPCVSDGDLISYVNDSTISSANCGGVTWSSNGSGATVNDVVFTPSTSVVQGQNTSSASGCTVEFDVMVLSTASGDSTPSFIEQVVGYTTSNASCSNGLTSSSTQSAAIAVCPACDGDSFCQSDTCNQESGVCETMDENEGDACDADDPGSLCVPDLCEGGECVADNGERTECGDGGQCFSDFCDDADGACKTRDENEGGACDPDDPGSLCVPDLCEGGECLADNGERNDCEGDECRLCNDETGSCEIIPEAEAPDACFGEEICRTPGFWGARGGTEKLSKGSQNITQQVIDSVGGLEVCGFPITKTNTRDAESAIEAICIKGGDPLGKLIRHLTASELNCALGECSANTLGLVAYCNDDVCGFDEDEYGFCSDSLDCFNNGGHVNADFTCVPVGTGECASGEACNVSGAACADDSECVPLFDSCHDRDLCAEDDVECTYEPLGPASSPKKCNFARRDGLYIFDY